jgi:hypothetical protein
MPTATFMTRSLVQSCIELGSLIRFETLVQPGKPTGEASAQLPAHKRSCATDGAQDYNQATYSLQQFAADQAGKLENRRRWTYPVIADGRRYPLLRPPGQSK